MRLVLIESADRMNPAAQNAFLKTLEEPPARTHLVLVTSAPELLLPTIRSRCHTVRFQSVASAEVVESPWWLESPIGTGPFKWSVYEPGQYTELVAFDDYWRGRPKLDKLINRFFPEAGSSVIALRSGEIAFTYLSADEALALEGEAEINILSGPSQVLNHLDFDLTEERFQDVRIRQAVAVLLADGGDLHALGQQRHHLAERAATLRQALDSEHGSYLWSSSLTHVKTERRLVAPGLDNLHFVRWKTVVRSVLSGCGSKCTAAPGWGLPRKQSTG